MYDFQCHLQPNEKILYQGKPSPGKGSKKVGFFLALIVFSLGIQAMLIWCLADQTESGIGEMEIAFIVVFLIVTVFLGLGIYGMIYNLFLKKRQIADDFYCLTNLRAMKYDSKKKKLVYGYLAYYTDIYCSHVKDHYGDLYMGITMEKNNEDSTQTLMTLVDHIKNPNPQNMPFINFESIKDPDVVMNLAKTARESIFQNNAQQDLSHNE